MELLIFGLKQQKPNQVKMKSIMSALIALVGLLVLALMHSEKPQQPYKTPLKPKKQIKKQKLPISLEELNYVKNEQSIMLKQQKLDQLKIKPTSSILVKQQKKQ